MIESLPLLIYGSAFLFICGAILFLVWLAGADRRDIGRRLDQVAGTRSELARDILKDEGLSDIPVLYRMLKQTGYSRYFRKLLDSANLSMTVGHFLLLVAISAMFGLTLTLDLGIAIVSLATTLLFGSIPLLVVLRIRNRRVARFESGFPEVLDMLRNAIRAGFTVIRAIQLASIEGPEPLRTEFQKTFEEINLGIPFKDALHHMIERIDSVDLKLFITAVLIQRDSGGNLNEVLQKISSTIRARFRLAGQMKIYTAQGRMTEIVLCSLPLVFIAAMFFIRPDYIDILFRDPVGHKLLGMVAFLQFAGFITIRKIIRIKIQ